MSRAIGTPRAAVEAISIDASRLAPYYQQLREQMRAHIATGIWPPGSAIPSERQLASATGLSRMTVRQAVSELTHEGLLRRIQGKGTFVVTERVDREVEGVYSFTEGVLAQGRRPGSRVIRQTVTPATEEEAGLLAVEPGEPLVRLDRVRTIDDQPAVVDFVSIPVRLCPALEHEDLSASSLYAYLRARCGLPPVRSTDTIEAVAANPQLARMIDVAPGDPLILMRRLALTQNDVPIELTEEYARPDRCRYRIRLVADAPIIELTQRPNASIINEEEVSRA